MIFVSAILPKFIVGNLILIMTVLIILFFVIFLIWGFIHGGKIDIPKGPAAAIGIIVALVLVGFVLNAAGLFGPIGDFFKDLFEWLFHSGWSTSFWENALFIIIIAGAIAVVLKSKSG